MMAKPRTVHAPSGRLVQARVGGAALARPHHPAHAPGGTTVWASATLLK